MSSLSLPLRTTYSCAIHYRRQLGSGYWPMVVLVVVEFDPIYVLRKICYWWNKKSKVKSLTTQQKVWDRGRCLTVVSSFVWFSTVSLFVQWKITSSFDDDTPFRVIFEVKVGSENRQIFDLVFGTTGPSWSNRQEGH